jgi:predicted membrane-bound mannosyltransferase/DNA-binding beta-propeller fold protein YncE
MTTLEQTPPTRSIDRAIDQEAVSPLNSLLARAYSLNWEAIYYVVLFGVAVLSRFVNLGDRVLSHDESLHAVYSRNLWDKGEFAHTPLMHGPVLFHMTALMFFLFGDSDFSARLYPAILGVILVLMPKLLFERWLGKLGAAVTSFLLLISPMILFHNRYIREDTPSIFFTLLMVYAIFAYVDGVRPRQVRWLILLSAAMLLSLATKEVAFMYIAIFGSFLTLVWLFQVIQNTRTGITDPIIAQVVGGVIGLAVLLGLSVLIGNVLSDKLASSSGTEISGRVLAVPIGLALAVIALAVLRPLQEAFRQVAQRGNSMFKLVAAGIIVGTIAALAMTCILSIIQPKDVWKVATVPVVQAGQAAPAAGDIVVDQVLLNRLVIWVTLMVLALALAVIGTALVRFARSPRLPWMDLAVIVLAAVLTCTALVFMEERTRAVPNVSVDARKDTAVTTDVRHNEWIVGTWVVGIVAIAGIAGLRFGTRFFDEVKRYPVFDCMIVMGTLVLPWLSAIPIFFAGYPLDESNPAPDTINAGILGTLPLVAIAIAAGLAWNPKVWLACAATFYSIFAFFFTTIFTNINGMFSGLVGSLGYWLAQQGVRRGSQPQYYYLLVELPVYEYLPVIGALVAGIVGLLSVWRFRADRIAAVDAALEAQALEAQSLEMQAEASELEEIPISAEAVEPTGAMSEATAEGGVHSAMLGDDGEILAEEKPKHHPLSEQAEGGQEVLTETQISEKHKTMPLETDEPPRPSEEELRQAIPEAEWLDRVPFLPFVGYWAVLILMALTMAGEKMPWLTTHLTVPLIFLTGWYVGSVLNQVDWESFWKRGWALILLMPVFVIALANVFGPYFVGTAPFAGLEREQLLRTFTWMGAVLLAGLVGYVLYRIWKQIGTAQAVRLGILGVFALLAVLTIRTAWMAAYINYDYATEYMVYAHGAPSNKTVMGVIEEISKRTTDGLNIRVAYDNEVSWPGSWYFRNYPQGSFKGDMSGVTDLDTYVAIVVGDGNNSKIENQLGDKFYKMKLSRLWWPMQDYFDLNVNRIDNVFAGDENVPEGGVSGSALRQGLWQIWWNRDYTAYGRATNKDFSIANWPVTDWMDFYVRKDVAAQIWDMGTGAVKVAGLPEDPFLSLRCDTCAANAVFAAAGEQPGQLNHPRGVAVGPDGNLYIADSQNARIAIFDQDGRFLRQFGTPGSTDQGNAPGGMFREPWGVAVGQDGTIYVADTWNHRVQVFDNQGNFLRMWGSFEQVAAGQPGRPDGFWGPRDIAVDSQNHVYVADTGNKRVRVYDSQGNFLYNIGRGGASLGQLNEPVGLAIDQKANEIYVADTWNKRISVFDLAGTHRRSWTVQAWGATTETGSRPYLALDQSGSRLFVTDPDAGRVLVFDNNGTPLLSFGTLASGGAYSPSQFGTLGGVTLDKAGRLFLADSASSRVLRFNLEQLPGAMPVIEGQGAPQLPSTAPATSDVF